MGINLPCGNTPLTTTECGGDCDEKIERLAERVSEAEDKLDTIQEGAEVNVNADWDETDPDSDAYIENKPSVNYDLSLGDSAPTVGSAVVGSAVLGTLVDIILGRGDGTEDRVSVSGTGAIQITRDGDTMTIHVPVGEIDQLRNGTDTEARAWAASVLKQWLDERIAQIPADQFLDLNKTVFANPFTWSSSTYPGSINPNLDGKPVLVLALTDGENVSYSFLNMEDLIDAYEGVAPISVNGSQISHDNSGVTAGSYGDSSNQTPNFGDTFKALRSTVDAKGHVTSMSEHTVKIPDTLATQESAGLMSAEDKEKLDNVDQLYKTTCGNPIVIDDADGEVKALNVELTPIQDLHGYDKPWAAGAGKNKLPFPYTGVTASQNGITVTVNNDGTIVLDGTATATTYLWLIDRTGTIPAWLKTSTQYAVSCGNGSFNTIPRIQLILYGSTNFAISESTGTTPADFSSYTAFAVVVQILAGNTFSNTKIYPQIEEGSTATSWTPYSNECPIYPHTSLDVRDTGVNQWDEVTELGAIDDTTGENISSGTALRSKNYIRVLPSTGYYVSGLTSGILRPEYYDANKGFISAGYWQGGTSNNPQTTPANCYYMRFRLAASYGTTYNNDISINYPSTDHDYHPYTGQTVTVPLNDLYGGSVDVIGGESETTLVKVVLDGTQEIQQVNWRPTSTSVGWIYPYSTFQNKVFPFNEVPSGLVADSLPTQTYNNLWDGNVVGVGLYNQNSYGLFVRVGDTTLTTKEAINAYLANNPITVVYPLATPTPLTTTPTPLTLYKGDNVISSDGDMCITYLQDRGDLTDFINDMKECCEEVKGSLLENLVDGSAQGSLRGVDTAQEDANYTIGRDATALGNGTKASGDYSVAEGTQTEASGLHSHAEGVQTKAMQQAAHAEGAATTANALFAHSEGNATNATGRNGHAEGGGTTASGENAHAEGGSTTASAHSAHAEGGGTQAQGDKSHAEGLGTIANCAEQHVGGSYNEADPTGGQPSARGTYVEIIGNGTSNSARSNARTLDWNGNEALQGALTLGKGTADEVTITAAQLQQLLTLI